MAFAFWKKKKKIGDDFFLPTSIKIAKTTVRTSIQFSASCDPRFTNVEYFLGGDLLLGTRGRLACRYTLTHCFAYASASVTRASHTLTHSPSRFSIFFFFQVTEKEEAPHSEPRLLSFRLDWRLCCCCEFCGFGCCCAACWITNLTCNWQTFVWFLSLFILFILLFYFCERTQRASEHARDIPFYTEHDSNAKWYRLHSPLEHRTPTSRASDEHLNRRIGCVACDLNTWHWWCCHRDNLNANGPNRKRVISMTFEFCSKHDNAVVFTRLPLMAFDFWRMPCDLISIGRHAVPCKQWQKYYKINYVEIKFNYCFRFSSQFQCDRCDIDTMLLVGRKMP